MSSYRGEVGAWDGGPPGAEADYAPQRAAPHAAPMPTTDPWTGVSYSQYGPPQYDYQGYSAPGYGYNYDSTYYQRPDGGYYDSSRNAYPPQQPGNYDATREQSRSTHRSRDYDRPRTVYRSKSRSVSPYDRKEREYSKKRESSYEESRRRKSRSVSNQKHSKYSSSDRSSYRSRSYSRSPSNKTKNRRRSESSQSSGSGRSYKKSANERVDRSHTPPLKSRASHSRNRSYDNEERLKSKSSSLEKESKSNRRSHQKRSKSKERRLRDIYTPPRKSSASPKPHKKSSKSSPKTNKKSERSPRRKNKYRERQSLTPPRKQTKDSSVTPPRCYARNHSSSSSTSRSRSRSVTPKAKHKRSCTPKLRRSRSSSSCRSSSSRSDAKRRVKRKSISKHGSRNNSRSRERSLSKGRSPLRHHSNSRFRSRRSRSAKGSKSRSSRSHSRSRSASPSEDECRGQFTVADRKRFWKMHRSRQEKAERFKTPPKEVRPPPGAVESTTVDDVQYGDPPDLEGPNFAELLPTPEQILHAPSSSKSKAIPIPIKNDGSFLEMFKKMQEETKKTEVVEVKPVIKKPILPFIGKRRGGRVLKTGLVKKAKAIDEQTVDNTPKDAWSLYMQEVKKYRETSCEEERKTRPLVK